MCWSCSWWCRCSLVDPHTNMKKNTRTAVYSSRWIFVLLQQSSWTGLCVQWRPPTFMYLPSSWDQPVDDNHTYSEVLHVDWQKLSLFTRQIFTCFWKRLSFHEQFRATMVVIVFDELLCSLFIISTSENQTIARPGWGAVGQWTHYPVWTMAGS